MAVKSTLARGLQKCVGNLWKRDDFSDFTIVVEDTSFPCHRFILSACSGFFHGLFRSQMKESLEGLAKLDRMTKETFEIIINSIYKGTDGLTEDTVLDVWSATHLLQIDYLIEECQQFVIHNVSVDNCFRFLNHAMMYSAQEVNDSCLVFIIKNFEQVRNSESFLQLPLDYFYKIIESDILATSSEDSAVDAILKWMEYKPVPEHCSWLFTGTLAEKTADEIQPVADISTYSLAIKGSQESRDYDEENANIDQENEKNDQENENIGPDNEENDQENENIGPDNEENDQENENIDQDNEKNDQEKGNDDQDNGANDIVKENIDQSAAFVLRKDKNNSISECCENRVKPKSNIITSDGNQTMCNKNSALQKDSKEADRKQHFLKLISACRLFLAKPACLESLLKNHRDGLISTGAYNMVLRALTYTVGLDRRHDAWPEAAVHRASSFNKHVMVFLSGNQFKAYNLDTGSVYEFAEVPEDYSDGNKIIVFDNGVYFSYQSKVGHIISMLTKQKSWASLTGLNISNSKMLLAHGNYVYDVRVDLNEFTLSRWSYAHGHSKWMTQTFPTNSARNVHFWSYVAHPNGNLIISFQLFIVVFITINQVVTAHCFNTETDKVHVCKPSMAATSMTMISFSSNEDVYVLEANGSLWKVFSTDTTPVDFQLVSKLWNINCDLKGCVLYRKKLYVFCDKLNQQNINTLLTSLPGICEGIEMIQIDSSTQCLPMVLPGSWFTS